MAIISCPECGRQVSDKALKCPQCAHPIANTNFQRESSLDHLQLLQEKIQEKLKDLCITVKIISVGNSLNIKLTRPAWLRINKSPTLSQVWIQIKPELTQDVLRGFNNLLITSNFEGDITSEWERQSDIDSTGKILPNKEEKTALQRWLKLLGISVAGAIVLLTTLVILAKWIEASREHQSKETVNNPPRNVQTTSSPSTSSPSTSSPEYLLAGIDKQSKDVSASELAPYTQALDQLESKCQESRMALADLSAWTQDELKKKGVETTHLKIMNAVYQSVKPYTTSQKCNSSFALIPIIVNK
jgi:hypothetical protein